MKGVRQYVVEEISKPITIKTKQAYMSSKIINAFDTVKKAQVTANEKKIEAYNNDLKQKQDVWVEIGSKTIQNSKRDQAISSARNLALDVPLDSIEPMSPISPLSSARMITKQLSDVKTLRTRNGNRTSQGTDLFVKHNSMNIASVQTRATRLDLMKGSSVVSSREYIAGGSPSRMSVPKGIDRRNMSLVPNFKTIETSKPIPSPNN